MDQKHKKKYKNKIEIWFLKFGELLFSTIKIIKYHAETKEELVVKFTKLKEEE